MLGALPACSGPEDPGDEGACGGSKLRGGAGSLQSASAGSARGFTAALCPGGRSWHCRELQADLSLCQLCRAPFHQYPACLCQATGTSSAQLGVLVPQLCTASPSAGGSLALALTGLCHPQMGLTQSSKSILVSDLPSLSIPEEALLDKLELFFSKTKNGGGEVESREFLDDSGQVMLTFAEDGGVWVVKLPPRGSTQPALGEHRWSLESRWSRVFGQCGRQREPRLP